MRRYEEPLLELLLFAKLDLLGESDDGNEDDDDDGIGGVDDFPGLGKGEDIDFPPLPL